jgi:hypothetical protein
MCLRFSETGGIVDARRAVASRLIDLVAALVAITALPAAADSLQGPDTTHLPFVRALALGESPQRAEVTSAELRERRANTW